jgi:cytochrome o ubiquinol oxidase operon protein cyoD
LTNGHEHLFDDRTPGVEEREPTASHLSYTVGLGLAILATILSFVVSQTNLLWVPGIPVGLIVLAIAQIGIHLVFFLHLGSGPDSTNNILALATYNAHRADSYCHYARDRLPTPVARPRIDAIVGLQTESDVEKRACRSTPALSANSPSSDAR